MRVKVRLIAARIFFVYCRGHRDCVDQCCCVHHLCYQCLFDYLLRHVSHTCHKESVLLTITYGLSWSGLAIVPFISRSFGDSRHIFYLRPARVRSCANFFCIGGSMIRYCTLFFCIGGSIISSFRLCPRFICFGGSTIRPLDFLLCHDSLGLVRPAPSTTSPQLLLHLPGRKK